MGILAEYQQIEDSAARVKVLASKEPQASIQLPPPPSTEYRLLWLQLVAYNWIPNPLL